MTREKNSGEFDALPRGLASDSGETCGACAGIELKGGLPRCAAVRLEKHTLAVTPGTPACARFVLDCARKTC